MLLLFLLQPESRLESRSHELLGRVSDLLCHDHCCSVVVHRWSMAIRNAHSGRENCRENKRGAQRRNETWNRFRSVAARSWAFFSHSSSSSQFTNSLEIKNWKKDVDDEAMPLGMKPLLLLSTTFTIRAMCRAKAMMMMTSSPLSSTTSTQPLAPTWRWENSQGSRSIVYHFRGSHRRRRGSL